METVFVKLKLKYLPALDKNIPTVLHIIYHH